MKVETIKIGVDCSATDMAFVRAWPDMPGEELPVRLKQAKAKAYRRLNRKMEQLHGKEKWRTRGPKLGQAKEQERCE